MDIMTQNELSPRVWQPWTKFPSVVTSLCFKYIPPKRTDLIQIKTCPIYSYNHQLYYCKYLSISNATSYTYTINPLPGLTSRECET